MRRLLVLVAALAVAALTFPAGAGPAYACTCVPLSVEEHVTNADVIVVGTVSRVIETDEASMPDTDAAVAVERYLKGTGPAEIIADDPPSGGTCGFLGEASLDQRYLLFLTGDESPFATNLCSGSTPLEGEQVDAERAAEMLQEVEAITGPGTQPGDADVTAETDTGDGTPWFAVIFGAAVAAGVLAAAAVTLRRRRTPG